ncbi:MAG: prepilin-type N-terminal cleavage/methylation domain-containing protein [Candidatus Dojkabacteria bacterium]|nr:prepilin-type N-terminal cleavage/methylation domain-containing protein [Candidatus Dojkabacteria bacterium]
MNRNYLQQKFGIGGKEYDARGFTLVELLVVMAIVAFMTILIINAVTKFKQVILVTSTAKEIVVYLREARRNAINNVVTSNNTTPQAYYIKFGGNEYNWGECDSSFGCSESPSIKSKQYGNVDVTTCGGNSIIKFEHVTGKMVINSNPLLSTSASDCEITVSISTPLISSSRKIKVDAEERTIKML